MNTVQESIMLSVVVGLSVSAVIPLVLLGSHCRHGDPVVAVAPSAAPSVVPSAAPSTSSSSESVVESPTAPLTVLDVVPESASWTDSVGCLRMASRVAGKTWRLPYPHHLTLEPGSLDCGFFSNVQQSGWRTAYCLEGNQRVPARLFLEVSGDVLYVRVNEVQHGPYRSGDCK